MTFGGGFRRPAALETKEDGNGGCGPEQMTMRTVMRAELCEVARTPPMASRRVGCCLDSRYFAVLRQVKRWARSRHRLITSDNVILFESCQRDVPKSPGARAAAMLSAGKQSVHQSIYRWEEHHEST
jgi:hypothetical protein